MNNQKRTDKMKKNFRFFFLIVFLTSKVFAIDLPPDENSSSDYREWWKRVYQSTYDDNFRFHGKAHPADPYIWVYSKEFAQRFRMPVEWADATLKGALALAWRISNYGDVSCGFGGNENSCSQTTVCQMDVYYDNRIELPWTHPEIVRDSIRLGLDSTRFVGFTPQSRIRRYATPPGGIMNDIGPMTAKNSYLGGSGIVSFDREFEPDVGILTMMTESVCPSEVGSGVAIRFWRPDQAEAARYKQVHRIEIPENYLKRIRTKYESEKNAKSS